MLQALRIEQMEHRTQEQSLCCTVSPVALSATNRIKPSKASFSLVQIQKILINNISHTTQIK